MSLRLRGPGLAALAVAVLSCTDATPLGPVAESGAPLGPAASFQTTLPSARISEIHYDNTGTDADERVEISGPAGTDLTGWSVVLYNGASTSRAPYDTRALTGTIPATCGTRGVVVLAYPVNGIQNGDPDGLALVSPTGVVEFLSYEGTFVAASGPAAGLTSVDIGVRQAGTEPLGSSLQRRGDGTWFATLGSNSFGACNDADAPPPAPTVDRVEVAPATASIAVGATQAFTATAFDASGAPIPGATFTWSTDPASVATVSPTGVVTGVAAGTAQVSATAGTKTGTAVVTVTSGSPPPPPLVLVHISEIHYDNVGTDVDERIEVEAPAGASLDGWSVVLYNGNGGVTYGTLALPTPVPASCGDRGVVVVAAPGMQNGAPDGLALVAPGGVVVEFLSYEGVFVATNGPATGLTSVDIGVSQESAPIGRSLQKAPSGTWYDAANSFGACNGEAPPPPASTMTITGRDVGLALPVGFEDQLFATVRDGFGTVVPTPITWTSETPAIASVDANGVVRGLAVGSAVLRATGGEGTTRTFTIPVEEFTASTTAQYANNAEFGEPTDASPADDIIVRRPQFITSFNPTRGIPNWVAYNLEATHIVSGQDRCDCFTFDPLLPPSVARYTTADYTGAGTAAGYGIDRGHLVRSFDRTAGALDNALTFYFSNIIPQAADNNQGPWAAFENYLGSLAQGGTKEVFVIAGASGSKGTVKNEGRITIPARTWKVAVILDRDEGLADVRSLDDLEVIAVNLPNDPGIRTVPWETYKTTVDAIEALSGYDLLALLPDAIEIAVESNTRPPVAAVTGPATTDEGSVALFSAAGSTDPDPGQVLAFQWDFGDGGTAIGPNPSHVFAQDGVYTVRVIVADPLGLADTATTTITVANVPPAIAAFPGATLIVGETYTAAGSFTDPGADTWTATVDYGAGAQALALSGKTFSLSRTYTTAGSYAVTVRVRDDDVESSRSATVEVLSAAGGITAAIARLDALVAAGTVRAADARQTLQMLDQALTQAEKGNPSTSALLTNALRQLDRMIEARTIPPADAAEIRALIQRVLAAL